MTGNTSNTSTRTHDFFRIHATDKWYKKMAELEEGCDICAGGGDIDDLIFHQEPEHEEEEK